MNSPRATIIELIEQGAIPEEKIAAALAAAKMAPDGGSWRSFVDNLLLWLGGLALGFAAMFFIAYNWDQIGRFAKFGLVQALMVLAVAAYWKLGGRSMAGRLSLLLATLLLGVLLALYGQTYQTGADTWELFFNWALLMLPWALVGRFSVIWVVWIVLVNVCVVLYYQTFRGLFWMMLMGSETELLWLVFAVNTVALAAWEALARRWRWLSERWAVRLVAVASGVPITWLALFSIADGGGSGDLSWLAWLIWLAALFVAYRKLERDLFMLAGGCLSGIVVVITFLARHVLDFGSAGALLLLGLTVIGLGAGSAVWLRSVHREWQS